MNLRKQFDLHYEKIQGALVLILFFSLPFFNRFPNAILLLLIIFSIVGVVNGRKIPKVAIHWFLPTLFVYYTLSYLLTGGSISSLEMYLILLAPLLFAINLNFYKSELKQKVFAAFILGNLVALIFGLVRATTRSFIYHDGHWLFDAKVLKDTDYDFLTSSVMGGNYFFGSELSYFLHPSYFGLYIAFAQYLIIYLSKRQSRIFWPSVSYLMLLLGQFLLSSKAAIMVSLLLTIYALLTIRIPGAFKITAVVAFAIITTVFVFFNPRFKVFKDTLTFSRAIDPGAHYGHALRVLSWDAALGVIKDNWLVGVGEAKKETKLVDAYNRKGYVFPAQERFNTHNQYLDFLLGGGLIGLGLFVYGSGQLMRRSIIESNQPLLFFLLIILFIALFENLLSRYIGLLFFSLFMSILPSRPEPLAERGIPQLDLKQQ